MLTLYTAVGNLTIRKGSNQKQYPVILLNQREYALVPQELVLWTSLAFQILTRQELEKLYTTELTKQKISDDLSFEHFLRRLLLRGLITEGNGLTGVDALYGLLGTLYIEPVKNTRSIRLFTCIQQFIDGGMKMSDIGKHLKAPANSKLEELILKLTHMLPLSVAELLGYMELGEQIDIPLHQAMDVLYKEKEETCDTLAQKARINHMQLPVLQAIGNLYLHKQILFQQYN